MELSLNPYLAITVICLLFFAVGVHAFFRLGRNAPLSPEKEEDVTAAELLDPDPEMPEEARVPDTKP